VRSAYDPRFKRSGADLWHELHLDLLDAVLGAEVEVPTLEKPIIVSVPSGSQPNSILRLSEKGLPYFGDHKRGDLYLRLNVHVPENLSDDEKRLYLHLRRLHLKI
jgi:DnaJ-class molecular chaperone